MTTVKPKPRPATPDPAAATSPVDKKIGEHIDAPPAPEPERGVEPIHSPAAPFNVPPVVEHVQEPITAPSVAGMGVDRALRAEDLELFDHLTGGPLDPETLFAKPWPHANYEICQRRVCERVVAGIHQHATTRLILPAGAQVTVAQANAFRARLAEVNALAQTATSDELEPAPDKAPATDEPVITAPFTEAPSPVLL